MKRHLLKLAVVFGVLALAAQAQALVITPSTDTPLTGTQTDQPSIDIAIAGALGTSVELYKQNVGGSESGALAGSYETTFFNTPTDPSGVLIEYVGGDVVGPTAFLLVKDGNQDFASICSTCQRTRSTGTARIPLNCRGSGQKMERFHT